MIIAGLGANAPALLPVTRAMWHGSRWLNLSRCSGHLPTCMMRMFVYRALEHQVLNEITMRIREPVDVRIFLSWE